MVHGFQGAVLCQSLQLGAASDPLRTKKDLWNGHSGTSFQHILFTLWINTDVYFVVFPSFLCDEGFGALAEAARVESEDGDGRQGRGCFCFTS